MSHPPGTEAYPAIPTVTAHINQPGQQGGEAEKGYPGQYQGAPSAGYPGAPPSGYPAAAPPGYPPAGPQGYPAAGPYPGGPQHPGGVPYPGGAPYPGGQYPPPQGYPAADVPPWDKPGHHVMGYPMVLQDDTMTPQDIARERKGVLIGTMTLVFGLCLPLLWLVGGFLTCCFPRSRRVRCIALMNSLAFIITTLLVIILPVTLGRDRTNNNNTRYNNRYYYYPPPPFQG